MLAPLERTTRFLPVTAFAMVAKFGQVIAAIAVANLFIRYINFLWFYSIATEDYFVADIDTRKFLLSNRKAKVKVPVYGVFEQIVCSCALITCF